MYEKIKIFEGVEQENIPKMLSCINAFEKKYRKNEIILLTGDNVFNFGIVLNGSVNIVKENVYGDRRIIMAAEQYDMFSESMAAARVSESAFTVIAKEDSTILFIPLENALSTCSHSCAFHNRLIFNLVAILAKKNLLLSQKIDYLSSKTTRERVSKYLLNCFSKTGNTTLNIPYNRNDLAEYLGVDRSVLSRELSKMKKEGILDFYKNTFRILKPKVISELYL